MTQFLSVGWIEALEAQMAEAACGSSPHDLTVQYVVDGPDGAIEYFLRLGPHRDHAVAGRANAPDVTFRMGMETARSISDGELSTEEAFISGRLSIVGDTALLIDAYLGSPNA